MSDTKPTRANDDGELPIGVLLRLCADGEECTPAQQAQVEVYCQEHADKPCCMEFERMLRRRVGRVMGDAPSAPQTLRASVERLCEGQETRTIEPIVRRDVAFWMRQRWVPLAAAAVIALAVGSTLVWQSTGLFGTTMPSWIDASQQASLVSFLDTEHARISEDELAASRKFTASTPEATRELVEAQLGLTPCALDLYGQVQLRLVGAGACQVPGEGKSIHAMYTDPETSETLSVFIQQDPDSTDGDPACLCASRLSEDNEILVWRYQGLIYYVVCPDTEQANEVMAFFGAPDARSNL